MQMRQWQFTVTMKSAEDCEWVSQLAGFIAAIFFLRCGPTWSVQLEHRDELNKRIIRPQKGNYGFWWGKWRSQRFLFLRAFAENVRNSLKCPHLSPCYHSSNSITRRLLYCPFIIGQQNSRQTLEVVQTIRIITSRERRKEWGMASEEEIWRWYKIGWVWRCKMPKTQTRLTTRWVSIS